VSGPFGHEAGGRLGSTPLLVSSRQITNVPKRRPVGEEMPGPRKPTTKKPAGEAVRPLVGPREEAVRTIATSLRAERETIRRAWVSEMARRGLGRLISPAEAEAESARIYDALVECLETGRYHSAQAYAQDMAERDVFRGIGAKQVIGRLLVLRDVCGRTLCGRSGDDLAEASDALDVYEPVVNRILTIVFMAFLQERERAVGRRREQLGALVEAGKVLAAERSLVAVLQRIVEVACRLLGARYGALGTLDASGAVDHFVTTGLSEAQRAAIGSQPRGLGILGVAVRERRPLRLRDLTEDPRVHGFPPHHPTMRSFLGVPIISRGQVFGHLYVTEKQGAEEFSKEDEHLAVTLAGQAAVAIENASLYEQLTRSFEELQQSQDLLVRQEKLASLGRLAAGVAHELNNPLSAVAGFAEALQRHVTDGACGDDRRFGDCREYLGMIQSEVGRAAAIVRRLLDFARQREPAFGPVDVGQVMREAVAFVERQARLANRQIRMEPVGDGALVRGDSQMLHQVLLNLLTNALDAVEAGGEITVTARRTGTGRLVDSSLSQLGRDPARVDVSTNRPVAGSTDWVEIVVSDTGAGIAAEHLPKIFDPFFTTKEVGKGTGLGLAICQSIVEQHGGRIEVDSRGPGQGTTVSVRLPLAA
jgi:signal transduction histidine kinase